MGKVTFKATFTGWGGYRMRIPAKQQNDWTSRYINCNVVAKMSILKYVAMCFFIIFCQRSYGQADSSRTCNFWTVVNNKTLDSLTNNKALQSEQLKIVDRNYDSLYYAKRNLNFKKTLKSLSLVRDTIKSGQNKSNLNSYINAIGSIDKVSHNDEQFENRFSEFNNKILIAAQQPATSAAAVAYLSSAHNSLSFFVNNATKDVDLVYSKNALIIKNIIDTSTVSISLFADKNYNSSIDVFVTTDVVGAPAENRVPQLSAKIVPGKIASPQTYLKESNTLRNYFIQRYRDHFYTYEAAAIAFNNDQRRVKLENIQKNVNWYIFVFMNNCLYYYSPLTSCSKNCSYTIPY